MKTSGRIVGERLGAAGIEEQISVLQRELNRLKNTRLRLAEAERALKGSGCGPKKKRVLLGAAKILAERWLIAADSPDGGTGSGPGTGTGQPDPHPGGGTGSGPGPGKGEDFFSVLLPGVERALKTSTLNPRERRLLRGARKILLEFRLIAADSPDGGTGSGPGSGTGSPDPHPGGNSGSGPGSGTGSGPGRLFLFRFPGSDTMQSKPGWNRRGKAARRGKHRPRKVFQSGQVMVYDDFLPPDTFRDLFSFCNASDFEIVHRTRWRKVWRLHDGLPLQGGTFYYQAAPRDPGSGEPAYPTGTVMDEFVERTIAVLPEARKLVGSPGRDWRAMSVAPWIYPVGSGLSLHCDGSRYSGAYTFFLHPQWNLYWGGLLLVLDPRTKIKSPAALSPLWLNDDAENDSVWDPGLAFGILPRPNRMVFIGPEAAHLISKVDANAGLQARISIAGFFVK